MEVPLQGLYCRLRKTGAKCLMPGATFMHFSQGGRGRRKTAAGWEEPLAILPR
jgi:hypothetical protein